MIAPLPVAALPRNAAGDSRDDGAVTTARSASCAVFCAVGLMRCVARQRRVVALVALLALAGCQPRARVADAGPYRGPTLTLDELVQQVNANNARLASLWAEGAGAAGGFDAQLRERPADPLRFFNGDINALYLAPDQVRLRGTKAAVGPVFDLGSDGRRFWLRLPTEKQLYIGTFAGLHPEAARQLPIRPDLVLEVLGVQPLATDLAEIPIPSLRFNPDSDAYMLTFAEPVDDPADPPERWAIVKEVWYDRQTLRPTLVILFDRDGRPVLRAYLSRHAPVGGEDGPLMATQYDLYFPDTGSRLQIRLSDLLARRRGIPNAATFRPPSPGDEPNVIDLDRPPPRPQPTARR